MPAISNSSPLILYSKIDRFDLLHAVFDQILIPTDVWDEVVKRGRGRAGIDTLRNAGWVGVVSPSNTALIIELRIVLGRGEAEAIALHREISGHNQVILDDAAARRVGRQSGAEVIGSAGVLVKAKEDRIIRSVEPMLNELIDAGLFMGRSAIGEVLKTAGEL